jgi:hypothetical protein
MNDSMKLDLVKSFKLCTTEFKGEGMKLKDEAVKEQ